MCEKHTNSVKSLGFLVSHAMLNPNHTLILPSNNIELDREFGLHQNTACVCLAGQMWVIFQGDSLKTLRKY